MFFCSCISVSEIKKGGIYKVTARLYHVNPEYLKPREFRGVFAVFFGKDSGASTKLIISNYNGRNGAYLQRV